VTHSLRMRAIWAAGPPKAVQPRTKKSRATSPSGPRGEGWSAGEGTVGADVGALGVSLTGRAPVCSGHVLLGVGRHDDVGGMSMTARCKRVYRATSNV